MEPLAAEPSKAQSHNRQPVFFVPGIIILFIALLLAIHLLRALLTPEFDRFIVTMLGILPARYMPGVVDAFPGGIWSALIALISYAFLHAGFAHLAINSAWLLAFGTIAVRKLGLARFLVLYFLCAILAGVVHVLVNPASLTPMVGASGAISGLMGAGFRMFLWDMEQGQRAISVYGAAGNASRAAGIVPLTDRRFLTMGGAWVLGNLLFGFTGIRVSEQVLMIAWDAHIAGFVTGILLIAILIRTKKT